MSLCSSPKVSECRRRRTVVGVSCGGAAGPQRRLRADGLTESPLVPDALPAAAPTFLSRAEAERRSGRNSNMHRKARWLFFFFLFSVSLSLSALFTFLSDRSRVPVGSRGVLVLLRWLGSYLKAISRARRRNTAARRNTSVRDQRVKADACSSLGIPSPFGAGSFIKPEVSVCSH